MVPPLALVEHSLVIFLSLKTFEAEEMIGILVLALAHQAFAIEKKTYQDQKKVLVEKLLEAEEIAVVHPPLSGQKARSSIVILLTYLNFKYYFHENYYVLLILLLYY
ncbi:MAG: hypothetical protein ACOZBL_02305 [Patescibacteria group bacterium]